MSGGLAAFSIDCPMTPSQTVLARAMIESRYPAIRITINPDSVNFAIPREGIYMPEFYGDFCKALNQETKVSAQPEKGR